MKKTICAGGLETVLAILSGKWKFLILWNLSNSPERFGELRRLVNGVSEKMLIQELKGLVADGIVRRRDFHEVPPRVEYSLTEFGMSLAEACKPLCEWGSDYMERVVNVSESSPSDSGEDLTMMATAANKQ